MRDQGFKSRLRNGSLRYFGEGSDYSFHGSCAEITLECLFYKGMFLSDHIFAFKDKKKKEIYLLNGLAFL